jgi:hypothetical protein
MGDERLADRHFGHLPRTPGAPGRIVCIESSPGAEEAAPGGLGSGLVSQRDSRLTRGLGSRGHDVAQLASASCSPPPSAQGSTWSIVVIHREQCWAHQTRARPLRVNGELRVVAKVVVRGDRLGHDRGVRDGDLETLCARRRDDVSGVADKQQTAVAHGCGDERAHRGD